MGVDQVQNDHLQRHKVLTSVRVTGQVPDLVKDIAFSVPSLDVAVQWLKRSHLHELGLPPQLDLRNIRWVVGCYGNQQLLVVHIPGNLLRGDLYPGILALEFLSKLVHDSGLFGVIEMKPEANTGHLCFFLPGSKQGCLKDKKNCQDDENLFHLGSTGQVFF